MKAFLAIVLLFFSFSAYGLDKDSSVDEIMKKHNITAGDLSEAAIDSNQCSVGFHVQSRRFFNNQRNAQLFCDDIHRFSRFGNLCHVRQYSQGFYGSSFSYVGFSSGRSFFDVLDLIRNFLLDSGLLNALFGLNIDFSGARGC